MGTKIFIEASFSSVNIVCLYSYFTVLILIVEILVRDKDSNLGL